MRVPDLRNVTIDGTPFVDAGGRAQSRYIGAQQDAHKAKLAGSDAWRPQQGRARTPRRS